MRVVFLPLLLFLSLSSPALAAKRPVKIKDAQKACLTGDYQKGIELLADLFVETKDPNFIYNQGRCLEQNHRWSDAIDRFREYLRKAKNLNAVEETDAAKHIADCEGYLEKDQHKPEPAPVAAPAPVPLPPPPPEPVRAAAVSPAKSETVSSSAGPAATSGAGLRIAGWAAGGAGVAALATGVVLNVTANNLAEQVAVKQSQSKASRYDSYKTWSYVGYGVGAGLLATGVALYAWGLGAGTAAAKVAILPSVLPGQATVSLMGVF
jgi:hypothetical protein